MPLVDLSADEAVAIRKANRLNTWGERSSVNRVEPIAAPSFDVPFRLEPGEAVFTIGSCFARNVERELRARGFPTPASDIFLDPEFARLEPGIINNYGAPSIYNELAWAFGEEIFDLKLNIQEVSPGNFADLHFTPSLRPEPWEVVLHRREAISRSYREAARCRVVIITLGLSELWFDTRSGFYLNVSPRPSMIKAEPGRFRLHVLSYGETHGYLDKALNVLRKHGHPDLQVLLTVSPVPLVATHRAMDVMVANSYSKSVLRTAAEEAVTRYPWVTYYPSYESIVLSDRRRAFIDDMVHVTDDIVAFNVSRMIEAYTDAGETLESIRKTMANAGEAIAVQKARDVSPGLASRFFEEHAEWSERSRDFAVEHAKELLAAGRIAEAEAVLDRFSDSDDLSFLTVYADAALKAGNPELAIERLERMPQKNVRAAAAWEKMLAAAMALDDPDRVIAVASRAIAAKRHHAGIVYILVARFFDGRKEWERSLH
ncbi:MAG: GSCFA domain-containing protein, partial [Caulobacteraceae bacterium]